MKNLFYILLFVMVACGQESSQTSDVSLLLDYEIINLENAAGEMAIKRNTLGAIIEQGFLKNGIKDGVWITYHDDENNLPAKITSFSKGIQNGPEITLSNRGQIEEMSNYLNNQLHGRYGKYRFGRPTVTTEYSNGQFDGQHKEYSNTGKLQKLIEFKDGKQHGSLQYFDEEGNITLEYTYKNGEKVSGGIVE
jgi:antitoxin component YwqK of YwqJK toxin-antitoxin module